MLVKYKGEATEVTVLEGVTSIGHDAFSGCSSLISIELPESVTSIEYSAFSGCSSLISIEFPEGVTDIKEATFSGCSSLTIYCKEGSYAQQYAIENELKYELIGASSETPTDNNKPTDDNNNPSDDNNNSSDSVVDADDTTQPVTVAPEVPTTTAKAPVKTGDTAPVAVFAVMAAAALAGFAATKRKHV